ncbi:NosL protein [Thiocapsa roseopersicina]|uniref:NosL protein n=2 Tax=Thiocapsa roseopersicina TaxID=1058 RepID=A0A1H3CGK1_THIRO|nr:nitrous oxide reductase accessory protein NosL [Thiocapsa roseopersicina]SDX53277.1 NosL protein [Thiocapsa roseopersicina]
MREPRPAGYGSVSHGRFVRGDQQASQSTRFRDSLVVVLALLLAGCGGDPGQGPVEVKWDRDACERCRMILSDRLHSAQVRVPTPDGRSRVYRFDDIGCALIWLEEHAERDDSATEIWVNDWRTGDWIDARTATYLRGQVTPMEYGLGAQPEPAPDGLDFAQTKAHIFDVEARFNVHGGHLDADTASPGAASVQIPPADPIPAPEQPHDHAE